MRWGSKSDRRSFIAWSFDAKIGSMMSNERPRLLLVTPPYHSGVVEAAGVWMPLNYAYLRDRIIVTDKRTRKEVAAGRFGGC